MTTISTFSIGDAAYAMISSQSDSWVSILNITEPANPTHLTVLENGANYDLNSPRHIAIIDAWLNFCCNYITYTILNIPEIHPKHG